MELARKGKNEAEQSSAEREPKPRPAESREMEGKHWKFSTWKELWDGETGGGWSVELNEKRWGFVIQRKGLDDCGKELLC